MLSEEEVLLAVQIQKQSFKLLQWLGYCIDKGSISFSYSNDSDIVASARHWIEANADILPPACRPTGDIVPEFANFFASYLTSSFEILDDPENRFVKKRTYPCGCGFVSYLENASRLQPIKPSKLDKREAEEICLARLLNLASEEGVELGEERAKEFMDRFPVEVAYSAYGKCLIDRMKGVETTPAVLVLWRKFAWKPEGSPKQDFSLEAADIFNAEQVLGKELRSESRV